MKTKALNPIPLIKSEIIKSIDSDTVYDLNTIFRMGTPLYNIRNSALQKAIRNLKEEAALKNSGLEPYVYSPPMNVNIRCKTCGTVNKHHPATSYCFICDTDNW